MKGMVWDQHSHLHNRAEGVIQNASHRRTGVPGQNDGNESKIQLRQRIFDRTECRLSI